MAFMNKAGIKISYDCQSLIDELKQDIEEFGSHLILNVVVQDVEGVTIYKDYNFIENDPATEFKLEPGEACKNNCCHSAYDVRKRERIVLKSGSNFRDFLKNIS